ncbi:MAG TPA: hypothetical protein PLH72_08760 [Vicinamibacterales bacterium]|nr:hypothetical protein [Vicinamibacterales bacterium]
MALPPGALRDASSADVIIVEGDEPVDGTSAQIVVRVTTPCPGTRRTATTWPRTAARAC